MSEQHQYAHAAADYLAAGLCVLPAHRAAKRPAIKGKWEPFKKRLPTEAEVHAWFANAQDGLCLVCGAVSGNLEMLDFDFAGERFEPWRAKVEAAAPGLLAKLVVETTQSGGWHAVYRSDADICGNLKLAQRKRPVIDDEVRLNEAGHEVVVLHGKEYVIRKDTDGNKVVIITLIETRGEGGLFLCAPTDGYEVVQGDLCKLPVVTEAERDTLLRAAWDLNEYVPPAVNGPKGNATVVPTSSAPPGSADRPGDDFNRRGNVRALLEQHGWTLARGGENEYWRRPGKRSGWSATLKDRVFYVFSANAAPFEPGRAYSPFSVYALLSSGGDFEEAARTLRQIGYGGDCLADNATGVDISGLVRMSAAPGACPSDNGGCGRSLADDSDSRPTAPDIADPGPIPEHLFHVPGFVAMVCDFTVGHAPYPNLGLAFCGAMALQSYLCARKVRTLGDLRPNIYLLALASSGAGKDFPRKVNSRVLFEIGRVAALGDKFASGEGIQDALVRSNAMLFQNDEMDGVLRQINLDRENKRESIPNILLTLYTSASDIYPIRVKAGQKEAAHIDQPHLTLFGTATPKFFYESLSQRMLTNGLFARMMIVDIGKRGRGQAPGSARDLPEGILQTARWWDEFCPGHRKKGNLYEVHPEPRVVTFTPEAEQAVEHLQRMGEDEYDQADAANDEIGKAAWSRTCENAKKLALLYACSENHQDPVIGLPAVEWATAFAMHQMRRQLYLAATYVAENPFHAECLKLTRRLAEAPDRQMQRQHLLRVMRCKAADFDQLVATLIQQGEVVPVDIPTKTKTAQGYRLA